MLKIDSFIVEFISQHRIGVLNPFFKLLSYSGELMLIWLVITLFLLYKTKQLNKIKIFLFGYLTSYFINDVLLKNLIQRPRPFQENNLITTIIKEPTSYSMPSGHSASSFVAAFILSYYFPKYRIFFYSLAVLIAFSRIYVGVHYPSDVIVGALIGLLIGFVTVNLTKKITVTNNTY